LATKNRPSVLTLFTSVQAGIDKHLTAGVTLGGVTYTAVSLKAVFALAITAMTAAEALRKQWMDAVATAHTAEATANALYELLRNYVISQYGKTANAVLGDFGMPVPQPKGPKTAKVKASAAAKSAATRQLRGTTSKLTSTMEVPVTAVTTVSLVMPASTTTSTTPAPSPAPATTGSSPKPGS
jgi:hypothetical protein